MKTWVAVIFALLLTGTCAAAGDLDRARDIVGILPLPEVFGRGACDRFDARPVALFASPGASSPLGRIHVSEPWTFLPQGGCQGLEVSVSLEASGQKEQRLPTLEYDYENPGAIVVKQEGTWFRIALEEGHAWVQLPDSGRFLPVERLLTEGLAYSRGQQPLYARPDGEEAVGSPATTIRDGLPVKVLSLRTVAGKRWAEVQVLALEPCTGEGTGLPPLRGWVPFHDTDGMPAVWFHPRGC